MPPTRAAAHMAGRGVLFLRPVFFFFLVDCCKRVGVEREREEQGQEEEEVEKKKKKKKRPTSDSCLFLSFVLFLIFALTDQVSHGRRDDGRARDRAQVPDIEVGHCAV